VKKENPMKTIRGKEKRAENHYSVIAKLRQRPAAVVVGCRTEERLLNWAALENVFVRYPDNYGFNTPLPLSTSSFS
jgi:hypothetical protein